MAPELLRCSNNDDIRRCDMQPADVYGFAMIVYEISTRKYPFEDEMENITATGNKSAFCFNMNWCTSLIYLIYSYMFWFLRAPECFNIK